jgi:ADP-heptose:LPS heptosyltransferase
MCNLFFPNEEPISGGWMTYNEVRNWDSTLVINRRYKNPMSDHIRDSYLLQIQQHEKVIFLGSQNDYDVFPLKEYCHLVIPANMEDWFTYIAKCSKFMGNQSAPLAIASALNTPRVAELLPTQYPDWVHYWGEEKYGDIYFVQ